jgi:hypothetical protein
VALVLLGLTPAIATRQPDAQEALRGIILFTFTALFTLHVKTDSPLHQVRQLQQILIPEQTPSSGHRHKRLGGDRRRPARWNRAQAAVRVVEVNSIFSPVVAIGHQLESLASQRMVWVDDFESYVVMVAMRCS